MSGPSNRSKRLLVLAPLAVIVALIGMAMAIAALGASEPSACPEVEDVGALTAKVPRHLVPIYTQAAERYHLGARGPSILAAINWVETGFGTDLGTSSAGAEGWMQFEPESWTSYGVDGDGDGIKDPDDPWDAIFAAARLLHTDGAPAEWSQAIWDYNHADWYVEKVLRFARRFAAGPGDSTAEVASSCEATAAPDEAVARMVAEAERLSLLRPSDRYVWGGSHGQSPTPANGPFDCSSAVSHLLQVGGFGIETMDTVGLSGWGEPGPGRWVTIWVKPVYDHGEAHTFIEFMPGVTPPGKRYWGTSGFVEPGHGPGWIPEATFGHEYLRYFERRHPPGM